MWLSNCYPSCWSQIASSHFSHITGSPGNVESLMGKGGKDRVKKRLVRSESKALDALLKRRGLVHLQCSSSAGFFFYQFESILVLRSRAACSFGVIPKPEAPMHLIWPSSDHCIAILHSNPKDRWLTKDLHAWEGIEIEPKIFRVGSQSFFFKAFWWQQCHDKGISTEDLPTTIRRCLTGSRSIWNIYQRQPDLRFSYKYQLVSSGTVCVPRSWIVPNHVIWPVDFGW